MKQDRITLHRLDLFTEVARRRSLSAASEQLRVSQPSISAQIRLLEKELGVKLWKKKPHGIELTPGGIVLLRVGRRLLRKIEDAKRRLRREFPDSVAPSLTVGGCQVASTALLPSALQIFKKKHPDVQIKLRTNDGVVLSEMVLKGEIDLAVVNGCPDHRDIVKERFGVEPIVACVSRKHPLATADVLTQEALERFGLVTRRLNDSGRSGEFAALLTSRGFRPRVAIECDSSASKRAAVLNQLGIALIYKTIVEDDLASGELVELKVPAGNLYKQSSLIYHRTRLLSPAAEAFLTVLREHPLRMRSPGIGTRHSSRVAHAGLTTSP